jgi:membrane-associated phospholipid phosphatase
MQCGFLQHQHEHEKPPVTRAVLLKRIQEEFITMAPRARVTVSSQPTSPPVSEICVTENEKDKKRLLQAFCRLLAAPTLTLLLSLCFTSRYVTLIIVFLLTHAKPLFYFVSSSQSSNSSFSLDTFEEYVNATLAVQKSMMAQFAVLASIIWVYGITTAACGGDRNVHKAFGNARIIIEFEQFLGIDVEPAWQKAALPHTMAMTFFNQYYSRTHFVVPILVGGYVIATKKDKHYFYRGSFALGLCLAMFGYMFVPTMPPRLLRRYANTYLMGTTGSNNNGNNTHYLKPPPSVEGWLGMIDSLQEYDSTYDQLHTAIGNPYAALPSMHAGWAIWSFLSVRDATAFKPKHQRTMWQLLLALHFLIIMYSTIVTANHYILDLFAGIAVTVLGRYGMFWILSTKNKIIVPIGKIVQ